MSGFDIRRRGDKQDSRQLPPLTKRGVEEV